MTREVTPLLYEQIVAHIGSLVDRGALRPGERIPSVRRLSLQRGVSINTVLQAYRLLEDRGMIEARPQSGYYVRPRLWRPPPEPEPSDPPPGATRVSVVDLVMSVLHAARSPDIVPLGAAVPSPELLPTLALNRAMASIARRLGRSSNAYEFSPGSEALRVQIARRALEAGCTLAPDDIITTCGCQEALMLSVLAVARPGDTIAIESPTFYGILQTIEVLGLRALEIPTHPRDGMNIEALAFAIEQRRVRAVLLVSNFNNPLGSRLPDARKRQLVALLAAHDIPLIEDDIYGDLGFDPVRPKSAKAFDRKGLVLLCSSFSKTLAPGYRVGWVAPGRFMREVERMKLVSSVATPTLPQLAIAEFLSNGGYDRYLRRVRRAYAEQVGTMTRAISRSFPDGTKVTRPLGGYVLWVELPRGVDALELHRLALTQRISIAPGPIFSAKQKYRNFVRLNCAHPWSEAIEQAVVTLGRLVAELARL